MDAEPCVPPGFRFHPTEEELVGYYLKRKIDSLKIDLDVIADIDLYRMEPWDIEDRCRLGYEEQNEWYFFSHKDRKYPTGTRTNRATAAGFWKATGRDKAVLSKDNIIGMRKTLVFYKGRAPNGCKTDWIMHEYRLQSSELAPPSQEEGWVVCRAFKKPSPNHKQGFDAWNNGYYFRNNGNFRPTTTPLHDHTVINPSSDQALHHSTREIASICQFPYASPQPLVSSHISARFDHSQFNELPQLDSPTVSTSLATTNEGHDHEKSTILRANNQFDDWGNLENIFDSKQIQPTSVLPYDPSTPLNLCNDELDAHGQISHFLGCFPDL